MAEEILEKSGCPACSANVRPGALFCYNCGSSVPENVNTEPENSKNNGTNKLLPLEEVIADRDNANSDGALGIEEKPIDKPFEDPLALPVGKSSEVQNKSLASDEKTPLKSAASLRKRKRPTEKKKVEVVWEPVENSPNILFIVVSLLLLLVAIGVLMVMLRLR